jgi:phosphoribosylglycinamide formyltransferase-1
MIEKTTAMKKRVVAFISGGGSNMLALAKACQAPDYPAEIVAVISDKPSAGGLDKAKALGIPTQVFERKTFASKAEHEAAILDALHALSPDIICLAGYMRIISGDFIKPFEGRILNIHPSLLPLFPGLHTHERALEAGVKVAGCTVHFVTEGMDEGPIIGQAVVPILNGDTADTLATRVLTVEHQLYPAALRLFAEGKVTMVDGKAISTAAPCSETQAIISI